MDLETSHYRVLIGPAMIQMFPKTNEDREYMSFEVSAVDDILDVLQRIKDIKE